MAKRKFKLSEAEEKELKAAYQQCRDGWTKIRYQAVRLYGTGYRVKDIEQITDCSRPSLMEWCRDYRQFGIAGLVDKRQGGHRAKLTADQIEQIQEQLDTYSPRQRFGVSHCYGPGEVWTVPDLAKLVKQLYGISYKSASSYRELFKRCDYSCQRPRSQYYSRHELKVVEFEQQLEKKR